MSNTTVLQLEDNQVNQLMALLDIARRLGTRPEATVALNWSSAIESAFNEQNDTAKEAKEANSDEVVEEAEPEVEKEPA